MLWSLIDLCFYSGHGKGTARLKQWRKRLILPMSSTNSNSEYRIGTAQKTRTNNNGAWSAQPTDDLFVALLLALLPHHRLLYWTILTANGVQWSLHWTILPLNVSLDATVYFGAHSTTTGGARGDYITEMEEQNGMEETEWNGQTDDYCYY